MEEGNSRPTVIKAIHQFLDGYEPKFLVTLNSKRVVPSLSGMENAIGDMDRQVRVITKWLNEYCLGSKSEGNLRGVGFFERMPGSHVLHCHLVLAMREQTRRTLEQVGRKVRSKWGRFLQIGSPRAFEMVANIASPSEKLRKWVGRQTRISDVRPIYDVEGAIRYCSKDFLKHAAANQICVEYYAN